MGSTSQDPADAGVAGGDGCGLPEGDGDVWFRCDGGGWIRGFAIPRDLHSGGGAKCSGMLEGGLRDRAPNPNVARRRQAQLVEGPNWRLEKGSE
jgi:hypothetical protein